MKELKKVFLYPSEFALHSAYKTLLSNPPRGYSFIYNHNDTSIFEKFKTYPTLKRLYRLLVRLIRIDLSQKIINPDAIPEDIDLVFSMGVLYNGQKSWVIDILDNPYSLAGYNYSLFIKNKKEIEKKLLNKNCRAILCANESSIELMKKHFSKRLVSKVKLVRPAVSTSPKILTPNSNKDFQILFMGSMTNPEDFYIKGGLETINCFKELSKKHSNLRLVIRCSVPSEVKQQISKDDKITIMETRISDDELNNLYNSSDVLSCPSHIYMLMSWLESMSHGLPIVALDTYASADYIKNNINGFLITPSKNIPYNDPSYPVNVRKPEFIAAIKKGDPKVIESLCSAFNILINNKVLKAKIGKNNQELVKKRFSIETRNKNLKGILDRIHFI